MVSDPLFERSCKLVPSESPGMELPSWWRGGGKGQMSRSVSSIHILSCMALGLELVEDLCVRFYKTSPAGNSKGRDDQVFYTYRYVPPTGRARIVITLRHATSGSRLP